MSPSEALATLGLQPGASPAQVEAAFRQLSAAVTADARPRLAAARAALLGSSGAGRGPLSATQAADLPAAGPVPTGFGGAPAQGLGDTPIAAGPGGLRPGAVLDGRYEVEAEVGRGGMGAVYAALDRVRGERVAVKVLLPHLARDPQARARFAAEGAAATRLGHPGIVRVFDAQEADGRAFLTMELLEGRSLRAEISERASEGRRFTVEEVCRIAVQLCDAMDYAHGQGVVHRDVKPENVWLCADGTLRVMDFGVARVMSPGRFTSTGVSLGTAYYMAPEQLKGKSDVDARADQYAVAVVVYELLTGDVPQGAVRPPHELRRGVPAGLSRVVMRGLAGTPGERFAGVREFAAALRSGADRAGRWSRWVAGVATAVVLIVAAGLIAVRQWPSRPELAGGWESGPSGGPGSVAANAALSRADTARRSMAAALAELPAALRPPAAAAEAKYAAATEALARGDLAAASAAAEESAQLAQGVLDQATATGKKVRASRQELDGRRDKWLKVSALYPDVRPTDANKAEAEYQAATAALTRGDLEGFDAAAERAGKGFDEAVKGRVSDLRGMASTVVGMAKEVQGVLEKLEQAAAEKLKKLESNKAGEGELALARQSTKDRTRVLKGFVKSERLNGLFVEAKEALFSDKSDGDLPVEAAKRFVKAHAKAKELTNWLDNVQTALEKLDAARAAVARERTPGVPEWLIARPERLLDAVPEKLLEGDGTAGLSDAQTATKYVAELPELLKARQYAALAAMDEDAAVHWYEKAAAAGDTWGMARLGWMYEDASHERTKTIHWRRRREDGESMPVYKYGFGKDKTEAVRWLLEAANPRDAWGVARVAETYANGSLVNELERGWSTDAAVVWYRKAADAGDTGAMVRLGWMYQGGRVVAGDEKEAVKWYRKAAHAGDTMGMMYLAEMYSEGRGVPKKDEREAVNWYQKAAQAGNSWGMVRLGWVYEEGRGDDKDEKEAVKWYRKATDAGDTWGMVRLGWMYADGRGNDKDEAKAVDWYRKAAQAGNSWGMVRLGWMYEKGRGVPKDEAKAVDWYQKAANAGDTWGMVRLGWMYADGRGVVKNKDEANGWFAKVVDAKDTWGLVRLGWMYEGGQLGSAKTEAAAWYRKAADTGDTWGMVRLGWMYEEGRGNDKDEAKAVDWYRKAAQAGNSWGMVRLGWMYEKGRGVPKDEAKAVDWYQKAAQAGDSGAMVSLGWMYQGGRGVAESAIKALDWYRKAADAGNSLGMIHLAEMYENENRFGFPKRDEKEAFDWYLKAAQAGNTLGMVRLSQMYTEGRGVTKDEKQANRWRMAAVARGY